MHVIRLRGPWEFEPLGKAAGLLAPGRVRVENDPAVPLPADFVGRVRFRRRFGLPTNLEPHQRVWLVLGEIHPAAAVALNDRPLDLTASKADVTVQLQDRNELMIELAWPCDPPRDVRLEIGE